MKVGERAKFKLMSSATPFLKYDAQHCCLLKRHCRSFGQKDGKQKFRDGESHKFRSSLFEFACGMAGHVIA